MYTCVIQAGMGCLETSRIARTARSRAGWFGFLSVPKGTGTTGSAGLGLDWASGLFPRSRRCSILGTMGSRRDDGQVSIEFVGVLVLIAADRMAPGALHPVGPIVEEAIERVER